MADSTQSTSPSMKTRIFTCYFSARSRFHRLPDHESGKKFEETRRHRSRNPGRLKKKAGVDFKAFVGRLRKAVQAHDMNILAVDDDPNFAYVLGATPAEVRTGDGVFQYWDDNDLWMELDGIVSERFVPKENYMVAPQQFADPASEYTGYRAGIRRVNGSWKFAYFVNG